MLDEKDLKSIAELLNSQANMILNELDKVQLKITDKMNRLESNMDELKQYYRSTNLKTKTQACFCR